MGLCMSSSGAAVAAVQADGAPASTAMVLLPTGELREYPPRATAAQVLQESVEAGGGWFLCDADAMGFEGAVSAVGGAEELRPGQIYFVLPAEAGRNGLRREDIAALAVKASAALVKKASSGRRGRAGSVSPLVFAPPEEKVDQTAAYKTVPALAAKRRQVARAKSAGRMQTRFAPDLTAIPECAE
ncbi:uncharacterized protein LOC124672365 [Lolium rigidum]|uniref:uncharacterized protein LOC124672365 n=1 Tax=Lolium rigidum TaxID=89674 RepID=UPI001F5DC9CF|nr:uncharacterized protein LOC124672365 [Lolium rigidum]